MTNFYAMCKNLKYMSSKMLNILQNNVQRNDNIKQNTAFNYGFLKIHLGSDILKFHSLIGYEMLMRDSHSVVIQLVRET